MEKICVGITGQSGFIGWHLYNRIKLQDNFALVNFEKNYFEDDKKLDSFVLECDCIVHLAGVNRCDDEKKLYNKNIELVNKLISSCKRLKKFPHIIFASSSQEKKDNPYGKSKREGRRLFTEFAKTHNATFTALVIPNVFGEFCKPNYNSVVATFAHKLLHNETPKIITDANVNFIYVGTLCEKIISFITDFENTHKVSTEEILPDFQMKVSELLALFESFKNEYVNKNFIPNLENKNKINLFNTFRSYIDLKKQFPVILKKHSDARGDFVETVKVKTGGQVSFSTTIPGITRGEHFHTRKIERFTVLKGSAKIALRKIGSDELYTFTITEPGYVDMPVWFTHNVTNIGDDVLYLQFWINEFYNPDDPDTFREKV